MQKERQPAYPRLYSLQGFQYCDLLLDQGRDAEVRERAARALDVASAAHCAPRHRPRPPLPRPRPPPRRPARRRRRPRPGRLPPRSKPSTASAAPASRTTSPSASSPAPPSTPTPAPSPPPATTSTKPSPSPPAAASASTKPTPTSAYARLALAEGDPAAARAHLAAARAIIDATGYHRRDGELADLEAEAAEMAKHRAPAPPPPPARPGPRPEKDRPMPTPATPAAFDVAIVCALRKPELEKVLATGTALDRAPAGDDASHPVPHHDLRAAERPALSVVAAAPSQMGMPAAAGWPRGWSSGSGPGWWPWSALPPASTCGERIRGHPRAGYAFDYGAGKLTVSDGPTRPGPEHQPPQHRPSFATLEDETDRQERLARPIRGGPGAKARHRAQAPRRPPRLGAPAVVACHSVEATKEHWRKLIGIEMEAYGVHHRVPGRPSIPPPMFLCMKAICDFAGPDKNDDWQEYARLHRRAPSLPPVPDGGVGPPVPPR